VTVNDGQYFLGGEGVKDIHLIIMQNLIEGSSSVPSDTGAPKASHPWFGGQYCCNILRQ